MRLKTQTGTSTLAQVSLAASCVRAKLAKARSKIPENAQKNFDRDLLMANIALTLNESLSTCAPKACR